MSSEAASLRISCFKQREEPLPVSYGTGLQGKNAMGQGRDDWGEHPCRTKEQQACSEVGFHFCPHTRAAAGAHSKPLTKAKRGDPAGVLRFA